MSVEPPVDVTLTVEQSLTVRVMLAKFLVTTPRASGLLILTLKVYVFPIWASSALKVKVSLSLPFTTGLKAIKVPRSCLLLLKINENTKNNTAPPIKQGYTVVWIPEEFIAP